jgi:hypothetical protein
VGLLRREFSLDLVDEVEVELEETAEEVDHQQLVLALVREELGPALGFRGFRSASESIPASPSSEGVRIGPAIRRSLVDISPCSAVRSRDRLRDADSL